MYGFVRWSNGPASPTQSITTPASAASYSASYAALTFVTIATAPVGLAVQVDGTVYAAPQTFYWWLNSTHSLAATQLQTSAGVNYSFAKWSNTGPVSQSVIIPESAASYTATFTPASTSSMFSVTSPGPRAVGQAVTLTATISPASATGNVAFSEGATALGTAALSQGQALLPVAFMTAGPHTVTASYSGDSSNPAASANFVQTVNLIATAVSLSPSANNTVFGQALTLTAQVSSLAGQSTDGMAVPSGQIQFLDGVNVIGTAPLTAGRATFSASSLPVGSHQLTAVYAGDASWAATTSGPLTQTVVKALSTTQLSGIAELQQVSLTVTVSPGATGSVQFVDSSPAPCWDPPPSRRPRPA